MISRVVRISFARTAWFALALLVMTTAAALAQTTTGAVRGYVRGPDGAPLAGTIVGARNTELNQERATNSNDLGFYNLSGLRPGPYQLTARRLGMAPQTRTVRVQIGQTLEIDFALSETAVTLTAVEVTAQQQTVETKTSEVGTNVTQEQINDLPSAERNFLNLAVLAPGTQLQNDRMNATRKTLTSGAQNAEQINVFIDGATYKNDILQGGVVGQDASRGNPFPRNAVQEFRVITQNYKAEYQKASSAIITATTKTGGPVWEGSAFFNILNKSLVSLDSFQRASKNAPGSTFQKPDFERYQFGASGGGPLAENLRVFGSFELNRQNRAARVNISPPDSVALDTIDFASRNGLYDQPFRAVLGFAKVTYLHTPSSTFDFSYNLRTENDVRDFGTPGSDLQRSFETGVRFNNDVNTAVLKHTYAGGMFLNEVTASYQNYHYNPTPNQAGPINRFFGFCDGGCAQIGSNISVQDFTQKRISLRNDLTYSGFQAGGSHVLKVGGNIDFANYDVIKRNSEIPRFVYEPWHYGFRIPQRVEFESGDPNFSDDNTQVGLYLQDDWNPTSRLVLNLGVRWDYESKMMNYDYATPRAIVDSLRKYEDRLFLPLDESRYFTDGTQRDKFYGAFQPRVGFAYGIGEAERTTLFGAWGIFYDRTLYDFTLEERFAQQHPRYNIQIVPADSTPGPGQIRYSPDLLTGGKPAVEAAAAAINALNPEVKLLPNDLRPPRSTQWTLGVRQALGTFLLEAAYSNIRSKNQLTFYWADADFTCAQRSFAVPGCFVDNAIPGFSTILFADNAGKTWYDAVQIKLDRFYRRSSEDFGWGGGIAYTIAQRRTQGFNDLFSFPNPVDYPKQKRNDERHRVVANWILDVPYLWGIQFSGLLTVGSGTRSDVGDRFACVGPAATCQRNFIPGGFDPPTFKTLDLRFRKDFARFGGSRMGVTVDLFNIFNWQNLGCFNTNPQDTNFGKAGCVISDPRRLQIGAEFDFARPRS
jgi:hypothetical protein